MGNVIEGKFGRTVKQAEVVQKGSACPAKAERLQYSARSLMLAVAALHVVGRHEQAMKLERAYRESGYQDWILLEGELPEILVGADLSVLMA